MRPKALTQKQIDGGILVQLKEKPEDANLPKGGLGLLEETAAVGPFVRFPVSPNRIGGARLVYWREIESIQL